MSSAKWRTFGFNLSMLRLFWCSYQLFIWIRSRGSYIACHMNILNMQPVHHISNIGWCRAPHPRWCVIVVIFQIPSPNSCIFCSWLNVYSPLSVLPNHPSTRPWSVWYKTKFGSQNLATNFGIFFYDICNVFTNMFNVALIMMGQSIVVVGIPSSEIWALENLEGYQLW